MNMFCDVRVRPVGMPDRMALSVSAANSSSLDDSRGVLIRILLGPRLSGFVVEGEGAMAVAAEDLVAGEDWEAGEKLSFDWRLRSRAFLGAMLAVKVVVSASPGVSSCLTRGLCHARHSKLTRCANVVVTSRSLPDL
jgi:hypothetical protein